MSFLGTRDKAFVCCPSYCKQVLLALMNNFLENAVTNNE